jgi:hypothetical protein
VVRSPASRAVLGFGVALIACSVYDESLLEPKSEFDPKSCAWGDCWWSEQRAGCRSADLPMASERPQPAPETEQEIVVALKRIWLGETLPSGAGEGLEPWQAVGLDLDQLCTSPAGCDAQPATAACTSSGGPRADGAGCRDNALAEIFPAAAATELGTTYGVSEDKLNCGLHRGSFSLLIRISGYGGGLDDSNVRVDLYPSPGLEQPLSIDCAQGNWKSQLGWISVHPWRLDQAALDSGAGGAVVPSKSADPAAYVKNGYLVARLPDGAAFSLIGDSAPYSGLSLRLFKSVITARIERDPDGAWVLRDGVFAGRLRREDAIASVRQTGFCDTAEYDTVLASIDASLDLLANGANAESAPCDALSVGIGFEALQATIGQAVSVPAPPECAAN